MGVYRTLTANLTCRRCSSAYSAGVQFKTGHDAAMPEYQLGDVAADLEAHDYGGIADAFCADCMRRWVDAEKHQHFEVLADDIAAGRIVARRATWRDGAPDGRPERGPVVTVLDEAPLSADTIRALANESDGVGWPSFTARLDNADIALWQGDVRLFPDGGSVGGPWMGWWQRHREAVNKRLRALGWPDGGNQYVDVTVRVDDDHRVWLAT